jgi:ABC-type lipoprotein export system ATPase subunit
MKLLQTINSQDDATILAVTHDPVVASYASRVLFLKDGKIYNEILKGEKTDDKFLKEITDINTAAGGEHYVR